jgi:hypothetical protein
LLPTSPCQLDDARKRNKNENIERQNEIPKRDFSKTSGTEGHIESRFWDLKVFEVSSGSLPISHTLKAADWTATTLSSATKAFQTISSHLYKAFLSGGMGCTA